LGLHGTVVLASMAHNHRLREREIRSETNMKKSTKKKIDELMKLYDEPLPELVIYSHDLFEPNKKKKGETIT